MSRENALLELSFSSLAQHESRAQRVSAAGAVVTGAVATALTMAPVPVTSGGRSSRRSRTSCQRLCLQFHPLPSARVQRDSCSEVLTYFSRSFTRFKAVSFSSPCPGPVGHSSPGSVLSQPLLTHF